MKKWIAFFSKSGSEIAELSNRLGRWPDLIVTNRNDVNDCNLALVQYIQNNLDKIEYIKNDPSELDYTNAINSFWSTDLFITLHGYMRIIPKKICETYEIYNGHPGLITKYPELKGKDPQRKAWLGAYKTSGCVIHKVTAEVDDGEVLAEVEVPIGGTLDDTISILHKNSIDLWENFLRDKLIEKSKITTDYRKLIMDHDYSVEYCEHHYPETMQELRRLQKEEFRLFCKKQFDYGPGNISVGQDTTTADGKRVSLCSIVFRCNDKVQRLLNLVVKNNKSAQNEPVMDAFEDLSLYGKIAKIVDKGVWGK
jgi:folate-dependent phosphoribosylglycinamide formyltransferase PurN